MGRLAWANVRGARGAFCSASRGQDSVPRPNPVLQLLALTHLARRHSAAPLGIIHNAKKPETRARRIETFIEMLKRGEMLYP
jgi:hypothetical protein